MPKIYMLNQCTKYEVSHFSHSGYILRGTNSDVETGGSGGSINRNPELLGAPEFRAKKFYARKEYATWHWRLIPLPRPGSRPSHPKAPPPPLSALQASSFSP